MENEVKDNTKWGGLRKNGIFKKSRKDLPLITVITAVYNGEKHLEDCLKSLYKQKYSNFEHIIIDGGSSDKTLEIIKKYQNKIDFWSTEMTKALFMMLLTKACYKLKELYRILKF